MKKSLLLAAAALAVMASGTANAATDGSLSGTSSTGTLDVNVTVDEMVRVSGLDDLTLTIDAATIASNFGSTSAISNFCVFSNVDALGTYNVTVGGNAGDGLGNPYGLTGTSTGTQLNHTVGYHDGGTYNSIAAEFMRPTGLTFTKTNTSDGQTRATDPDCVNVGDNSSLRVTVRNPVALAALADTYTGTLSVIVSVP